MGRLFQLNLGSARFQRAAFCILPKARRVIEYPRYDESDNTAPPLPSIGEAQRVARLSQPFSRRRNRANLGGQLADFLVDTSRFAA